ncbi:MAG TPA: histidine kinase [Opitutaceae bacterium]|nr:histidine kinase [Opitutaceae bacterium]
MSTSTLSRLLLRAAGLWAFWTIVGLAFASQFYLSSSLLGRTVTWQQAISYSLADWYVWAVLSVPVLALARRFPPERVPLVKTALVHLGAGLICSFVYVVLRAAVGMLHGWLIDEPAGFADVFRPLLLKTFPFNLLVYGVIVSISHSIDYYRKYHERTVQTLELEKHLTEARLQSLLRQLKPHFLFNTLNGIASLMHTDVDAADTMLVRLSELLRLTMTQTGRSVVSLAEEIAFLERYLAIETIRFRDRLSVEFSIEAGLDNAQIPNLILQPIVENAIRHGIEPYPRPGRINVVARRRDTRLILEVRDTGNGLQPGGPRGTGIGVANTRARLQELYGSDHRYEMNNRAEGGLSVVLDIPYQEQT